VAWAAPEDTLAVNPAQQAVYLDENYYNMLEAPSGKLTVADVQSPAWSRRFVMMRSSGHPANINRTHSAY
jgi:hypothetical protein